jgi:hypothetical protein
MEKLTNFDIFYGSAFFLLILMLTAIPLFYLVAFLFDDIKNKIFNIYKLYIKVFYVILFIVVVVVGVNNL